MAVLEGPQRVTRGGPSGVLGPDIRAPRTRSAVVAPLTVGLVGFTIAVAGIGIPSVWYDEAATITAATRSWPQLWAMLGNVDAVHGLYYALMHVVFDLFGYSPIALRMPSALAIGVAAALVVILGRQLGRPRLAVIAGIVFVLLPRVTWAGTEGRSYAITAMLAVLLTVVLLHAQRHGRRWWVAYSALALLSVAVFVYLALIVAAHAVTVLWQRRQGSVPRGATRRWMLAAGIAALASLPLAQAVIAQSGQVAWIASLSPHTVVQILRAQWFYSSVPFAIAAWAFILVGVSIAVRRRQFAMLAVVLPAMLLPTLALVAASTVDPIYLPRYLTMSTPFVALAIAAGIDVSRRTWVTFTAVGLLVALALPQIVEQRSPEAKENSSWSQVADLIATQRAAEPVATAIVYGNVQRHPSATARVMAYSYPDAFRGTIDLTLETPAAETAQLWETRSPIALSLSGLADAQVTYLITSEARDLRPETTAALESAGWRLVQSWEFTAVHVLKYERG